MVPYWWSVVDQIDGGEVVADADDDELCGFANSGIVSELPCRLCEQARPVVQSNVLLPVKYQFVTRVMGRKGVFLEENNYQSTSWCKRSVIFTAKHRCQSETR